MGAGDYIAATASYDLFKLKMLPEMRTVFEDVLGLARYWAGDKILELRDPKTGKFWAKRADDPMWARVILRSANAKGGLESATAKAAWLDECGQDDFTLETWEAVRRRLSIHRGRALGTTTPYNLGWLKTAIVDKAAASGGEIEVVNFPSYYNPQFSREEFESARRNMPAWRFQMFYEGRYAKPPGLIYKDFDDRYRDDGGHLVKPFALPSAWPRYVGVDPGGVNYAMVWLAHDVEMDCYYLYRESLDGGISTPEHARRAAALAQQGGERVLRWFVGQQAESQIRRDWQAAGVRPVFAPKVAGVEDGIDRVIRLLRQGRLYVFDSCGGVLDEIGRYSRVMDAQGEPTEAIKDKEMFHRLDALRYAAVGVTSEGVLMA